MGTCWRGNGVQFLSCAWKMTRIARSLWDKTTLHHNAQTRRKSVRANPTAPLTPQLTPSPLCCASLALFSLPGGRTPFSLRSLRTVDSACLAEGGSWVSLPGQGAFIRPPRLLALLHSASCPRPGHVPGPPASDAMVVITHVAKQPCLMQDIFLNLN